MWLIGWRRGGLHLSVLQSFVLFKMNLECVIMQTQLHDQVIQSFSLMCIGYSMIYKFCLQGLDVFLHTQVCI